MLVYIYSPVYYCVLFYMGICLLIYYALSEYALIVKWALHPGNFETESNKHVGIAVKRCVQLLKLLLR